MFCSTISLLFCSANEKRKCSHGTCVRVNKKSTNHFPSDTACGNPAPNTGRCALHQQTRNSNVAAIRFLHPVARAKEQSEAGKAAGDAPTNAATGVKMGLLAQQEHVRDGQVLLLLWHDKLRLLPLHGLGSMRSHLVSYNKLYLETHVQSILHPTQHPARNPQTHGKVAIIRTPEMVTLQQSSLWAP